MRERPTDTVEAGRVTSGPFASIAGIGCNGAFLVAGPLGRDLKIIVSDGDFVPSEEVGGWEHASVSIVSRKNRTPSWDEMQWVKEQFWEDEGVVLQYHPRKSEYVNVHPGCLHLWRPVDAEIPVPPIVLV